MPWSRMAVEKDPLFQGAPYELPGLTAVFDTRFIYPDPSRHALVPNGKNHNCVS
jgi:hypothetical protein